MTDITCDSPAKINLFLHVTGKRSDGYHTLHTLMCRLTFGDRLEMHLGEKGLEVICNHPDAPGGKDNSAYKAAMIFYTCLGKSPEARIRIEKQIPVGAGLGGGSSNAAATFLSLNKYYNSPFSRNELMEMGLKVGADVPFFIFEKAALAEGVGEKLKSVALSKCYKVILVYPGRHVSTADVYKNLNFKLTNPQKKNNNLLFSKLGDVFFPDRHLWNDLEAVTIQMVPEIETIKGALIGYGADGALMSGSGSTVFGLFSDETQATHAYDNMNLAGKPGHEKWKLVLTELLP